MKNRRILLNHIIKIYFRSGVSNDEDKVMFNYLMNGGAPLDLISKIRNNSINKDLLCQSDQISKIQFDSESINIGAGLTKRLAVLIYNGSNEIYVTSVNRAIFICYHIYSVDGEIIVWDGLRTSINDEIKPGEQRELIMLIKSPELPGIYKIEPTLLMEGSHWLESKNISTVKSDLHVISSEIKVKSPFYLKEEWPLKRLSVEEIYQRIEIELI